MKKDEKQDIIDSKGDLESKFNILAQIKTDFRSGYTGAYEFAVVTFILGAVGGSFFSELGKDLWKQTKRFCKKIYSYYTKYSRNKKVEVNFVFDYSKSQIVASITLDQQATEKLPGFSKKSLIDIFWNGIGTQIMKLMKSIDEGTVKFDASREINININLKTAVWNKILSEKRAFDRTQSFPVELYRRLVIEKMIPSGDDKVKLNLPLENNELKIRLCTQVLLVIHSEIPNLSYYDKKSSKQLVRHLRDREHEYLFLDADQKYHIEVLCKYSVKATLNIDDIAAGEIIHYRVYLD